MDTPAAAQTPAEHELAELIVQSLNIDWVKAEAIAPDAALFGGDLGLDSIDALELALAISKRYGFQLRSDNPDNKRIFGSLRALADHIRACSLDCPSFPWEELPSRRIDRRVAAAECVARLLSPTDESPMQRRRFKTPPIA